MENENYIMLLEKFPHMGIIIQIWDKRVTRSSEKTNSPHVLIGIHGVNCLPPSVLDGNSNLDRLVVGLATKHEILRRKGIYRLNITQEEVFRIADALGFGINARPSIQEVMS